MLPAVVGLLGPHVERKGASRAPGQPLHRQARAYAFGWSQIRTVPCHADLNSASYIISQP